MSSRENNSNAVNGKNGPEPPETVSKAPTVAPTAQPPATVAVESITATSTAKRKAQPPADSAVESPTAKIPAGMPPSGTTEVEHPPLPLDHFEEGVPPSTPALLFEKSVRATLAAAEPPPTTHTEYKAIMAGIQFGPSTPRNKGPAQLIASTPKPPTPTATTGLSAGRMRASSVASSITSANSSALHQVSQRADQLEAALQALQEQIATRDKQIDEMRTVMNDPSRTLQRPLKSEYHFGPETKAIGWGRFRFTWRDLPFIEDKCQEFEIPDFILQMAPTPPKFPNLPDTGTWTKASVAILCTRVRAIQTALLSVMMMLDGIFHDAHEWHDEQKSLELPKKRRIFTTAEMTQLRRIQAETMRTVPAPTTDKKAKSTTIQASLLPHVEEQKPCVPGIDPNELIPVDLTTDQALPPLILAMRNLQYLHTTLTSPYHRWLESQCSTQAAKQSLRDLRTLVDTSQMSRAELQPDYHQAVMAEAKLQDKTWSQMSRHFGNATAPRSRGEGRARGTRRSSRSGYRSNRRTGHPRSQGYSNKRPQGRRSTTSSFSRNHGRASPSRVQWSETRAPQRRPPLEQRQTTYPNSAVRSNRNDSGNNNNNNNSNNNSNNRAGNQRNNYQRANNNKRQRN